MDGYSCTANIQREMRQYTRFMLRTITVCLATALIANASNAQTILVHGHRGSRATRPENTIPAFEYAIQHGADVLELDLAVTKDNVLVVSHFPFITADYPGERVCVGPAFHRIPRFIL
jgi:glycerophosphoryl diester phosphodiesterase